MHPYATNLPERHNVPLVIAAAAFGGALLIGYVERLLGWSPPAWLDVPSTAALYGIGYSLFKKRLWRWKGFARLGAVNTPVLEGDWEGEVITSFDEHAGRHPVRVRIDQNWTEMSISLRSEFSQSQSVIAGMTVETDTVLSYEYYNEPVPGAVGTMHAHRGTARLTVSRDGDALTGQYYSGRDRQNFGELRLRRSR